MGTKRILVLGGGFAGLWSAVGAARRLDELGQSADVEVTLVNRDAFHSIRVRNYEADLTSVRAPLDDVLGPIGVRRVEGEVVDIDATKQVVAIATESGQLTCGYDRLVCALGSELLRPNSDGLADHAFDVDTYRGALFAAGDVACAMMDDTHRSVMSCHTPDRWGDSPGTTSCAIC